MSQVYQIRVLQRSLRCHTAHVHYGGEGKSNGENHCSEPIGDSTIPNFNIFNDPYRAEKNPVVKPG